MRLKIINGRIIDPANNIDETGDICIADGNIVSVLDKKEDFTAEQTINADEKLVIPGMVDLCARFREPGEEHKATIAVESKAASAAGITSICHPPDTIPVIDSTSVVELIHQRTEQNFTRIFPLGALTYGLEGERLAEMKTLVKAGCVGVSNGNKPVRNSEVLRRALEYAASFDIPVFYFPEDYYLRNDGVIHEGATSTRLGLPPIPATAETAAVSQALLLMEQTGVRLHICRLSTAKSVVLIDRAKKDGLPVTADVGICNLHLCDTDIGYYDTSRHLVPPLRSNEDKLALREGIANGVIDAICSDHQPHDDDAKTAPFSDTEPGASTVDALFPSVNRLVMENCFTLNTAIAALTANPAKIMGIDHGTLAVGSKADITIIDPSAEYTVSKERLISTGKNTPFDGWKLNGVITHTLKDGEIIYGL